MEYLTESQIKEKSFIMIELENGQKKAYLVFKKRVDKISGAMMLLGYLCEELLKKGNHLLPSNDRGISDRYYIALKGQPGKDRRVCGYRHLTEEEKNDLKKKLQDVGGGMLNYINFI